MKMKKGIALASATIWAIVVGLGMVWMTDFSARPGTPGISPEMFPEQSAVGVPADKFKLLLFLNPQCPCSRATLTELGRIVERFPAELTVSIKFYRPESYEIGWVETPM